MNTPRKAILLKTRYSNIQGTNVLSRQTNEVYPLHTDGMLDHCGLQGKLRSPNDDNCLKRTARVKDAMDNPYIGCSERFLAECVKETRQR